MNDFSIKKIKGDIAELICKHHFELMGCDVNKVGIENLSITFAKLRSKKSTVQSIKNLMQYMPDFLVVHPNKKDASFVEVKYRKEIKCEKDLLALSKQLHKRYKSFIDDDIPVYFYLVTNIAPYIYIMKANTPSGKENAGGFFVAGDKKLDYFSFFKGYQNYMSFNNSFNDVIRVSIKNLFIDTEV